jgi:uncharacterized membrane protein
MKDFWLSKFSLVKKIILLLLIVFVVMAYNFKVFTTNNSIHYVDSRSDLVDVPLNGQVLEQHFFANEPVRSIEMTAYQAFDKDEDEVAQPGQIEIEATLFNYDSGETLGVVNKTLTFKDEAFRMQFDFDDTLTLENTEFGVRLKLLSSNLPIYVFATDRGYAEKLYVNGNEVEDHRLIFKAQYSNNLLLSAFAFTLVLLLLSLVFLLFPQMSGLKPHQFFIVLALISGIGMAYISPSGQEPDVGDHILRSFDVSYGHFTPIFRQTYDQTVQMPTNFSEFDDRVLEPGLNKGLAHTLHLQNTYFATGEMGVQDYRYKASYSTVTYWPQGLGLYLGRVFQWNAYETIILARILNLIAYILLAQLAIMRIPVLKNTLMIIALMPIAVFQSSSLSADAVLNGLSFLFVASVIRLAMQKTRIHLIHLVPSLFCLYFVVLAKPPYIILALLYFVLPLQSFHPRFAKVLRYVLLVAGAAFAAAVIFGFSAGWLKLAENKPAYDTQMQFVMHNLATTLKIFFDTLDTSIYQYLSWLNMLGWINYSLGILILVIPMYIVLVGLADAQPFQWQKWQRWVIWGTFALAIAGIFIGLYVFDIVNSIGASTMLGAQGRYFIPMFILPFMALKRPFQFRQIQSISPKLAGISGVFLTYTLYTLTRLVY